MMMVDWQGKGIGEAIGSMVAAKLHWCYLQSEPVTKLQSVLASTNHQKASIRMIKRIKAIVLAFMVTPYLPYGAHNKGYVTLASGHGEPGPGDDTGSTAGVSLAR